MIQIDAHCHIGSGWRMRQTVDELLREMDRCGVDRAVVCPVERHIVVYNREGNDFIADAVRAHPDRLIGFATVNPWYGEEGVAELERAVQEGLVGLKVHSSLQGFFAHDALIYPLMEKVQELGLVTYFHTNTPIYAMPFQLADLAERFPRIPFILGHMGFADGWTDVVAATEKLRNVVLETSLTGPMVIAEAMAKVGPERMVFGSNAPVSSLEAELYKIQVTPLPPEARRLILGENMVRMLKACGEG